MEEEDPWNGGWAKDGTAEEPARVEGASAAGREGTRRSEKAKESEEALLTRSSKAERVEAMADSFNAQDVANTRGSIRRWDSRPELD